MLKTDTILDKIVAQKVMELGKSIMRVSLPTMRQNALESAYPVRDFAHALNKETVALIAECKKASPSKGVLMPNFDAVALASLYEAHGASAISVLTDETFFQGHLSYMQGVREAVGVPVLRKDFVIHEYQIHEARAYGADAVLLIVACLEDIQLRDLRQVIESLGMTALVEVHDEAETERALASGASVIGVNNRDLKTFRVDVETTVRLAKLLPSGGTLVAESGIFTVEDVQKMADAGSCAVLVGESLVKSESIGFAVQQLAGVQRR